MMHVIDAVLDSFADLFRSHRYPPIERLYSVFLFSTRSQLKRSIREAMFDSVQIGFKYCLMASISTREVISRGPQLY